jgi:hypothetical protein
VTAVNPNSGPTTGGVAVEIIGTNFADRATVLFGSTPATSVTFASPTRLIAYSPVHAAGPVPITVTVDGQSGSLANGFTYFTAYRVTAVSPTSGLAIGGTPVTITGTNFVPGMRVWFGGTEATPVTVINSTTISTRAPPRAAGQVQISVTFSWWAEYGAAFTYYTFSTELLMNLVKEILN